MAGPPFSGCFVPAETFIVLDFKDLTVQQPPIFSVLLERVTVSQNLR